MEIRIQSVNFDATEQLKAFVEKKVSKLEKSYEDIQTVEIGLKGCQAGYRAQQVNKHDGHGARVASFR